MEIPKQVAHKGVPFEFRGAHLIVPALTAGQMETVAPLLDEHDSIETGQGTMKNTFARMEMKRKVIHTALTRNYPDITVEDTREFVDVYNDQAAFYAALGYDRISKRVKDLGEIAPAPASLGL